MCRVLECRVVERCPCIFLLLEGTLVPDLNSDDNHNFFNDIDNSNDDDDDGNNNDIYNNDDYHYPSELGQIIRIGAFVCLLLKEFRISLISLLLYCLILEAKSHMSSELVSDGK